MFQAVSGGAGQGGCPFALYDRGHLQTALREEGLRDVDTVLDLAENGQYSEACKMAHCQKIQVMKWTMYKTLTECVILKLILNIIYAYVAAEVC